MTAATHKEEMTMEAITYKDMVFVIGEVSASICELDIIEKANEHGEISVTVILDEKKRDKVLHESKEFFSIFYSRENKIVPLFQGIITFLEMAAAGEVYYMQLKAKTFTYFMDFSPRSQSYQNIAALSHDFILNLLKSQNNSQCLFSIPNSPIKEFVVQYEETDWEFLKRFVSRYGACVFVNSAQAPVCLQIGLGEEKKEVEWDNLEYTAQQNIEEFQRKNENRFLSQSSQEKNMKNFIRPLVFHDIQYSLLAYNIVPLGCKVMFHKKEMIVGKIQRKLAQGILISQYTLFYPEGLRINKYYNDRLTGCSIYGNVEGVHRNKVQARLQIDGKEEKSSYWFPFSTVAASNDGSGWYCMPKQGEQVRIFFPVHDEKEGYAVTCAEGHNPEQVQEDDPMGNPNSKNISTPDGNNVKFTENGIELSTNGAKGQVTLTNDGSIKINGIEKISFWAGERIQISAEKQLNIWADSKVTVQNDKEAAFIITENDLTISGVQVHENLPN